MPRHSIVKFVVGTSAHNAHVQHIVRSLYEANALRAYLTGGVDVFRSIPARLARSAMGTIAPSLDRLLQRRAITEVPGDVVYSTWRWETPRILASRIPRAAGVEDWLWERSELALDRRCATWMRRPDTGGFFGVEHGALAGLRAAQDEGKPGIVAFLSPHHSSRAKWVDRERERFPDLLPPARTHLERLAPMRDARRDQEARTADWIEAGSSFTARSLVEAGFPQQKILTVTLGGMDPVDERHLPVSIDRVVRFAYVGPVSIRKGAHYLLRAWPRVAGSGAELHLYGKVILAPHVCDAAARAANGASLTFHGSVSAEELSRAYLQSSVLVLPTLCDGFGLVVTEALAHGLPVITTANAGAADLIEESVNGFVLPPADEDALAARLQWCIDHPHELFAMRRAALASASRWTWADFRRRQIDVLERVLTGRDRPAESSLVAAHAVR